MEWTEVEGKGKGKIRRDDVTSWRQSARDGIGWDGMGWGLRDRLGR